MGNCLRRGSSSMVWAGEDWGSVTLAEKEQQHNEVLFNEKKRLLSDGDHKRISSSSSSFFSSPTSKKEVKIKITKKELEKLVRDVDMQGLSLEQVLARMINGGDDINIDRYELLQQQRAWRPALQSIPEVN